MGFGAVAVSRTKKVFGHFCKNSRKSDRAYKVVHFNHIQRVLRYIWEDRCFVLGNHVLYRIAGWPQGGSLSEPGTLVDLNEDIFELHAGQRSLSEVGWCVGNPSLELEQVVLGLLHVDDSLLMSKILCVDCLENGIKNCGHKMWELAGKRKAQ